MLTKFELIQILLFCEFVQLIHVHNSGNPYEFLYPNSVFDQSDGAIDSYGSGNVAEYQQPSYGEKYVYPYGNVGQDYGIVNMTLLSSQSPTYMTDANKFRKDTKKNKNRIGFYNVQSGDEFFLNDFEVRPKFKTKQTNKHVLGYEYTSNQGNDRNDQIQTQKPPTSPKPNLPDNPRLGPNAQIRPQTNNRRKHNNKTTNKRRRPALQNSKPPKRANNNRRPSVNMNKNTIRNSNNKKGSQQNRRKVQNPQNTCRKPNIPLKNSNNRRPISNRPTVNKINKLNQNRKPIRKINNNNNRRKNTFANNRPIKRKPMNRFKTIQSRDSNPISDVIKKYITQLKSNAYQNSIDRTTKSLDGRQRSLFSMTLNQIRNQSVNIANKFFSLFTVVQYPNYRCIADRHSNYYEGTCYQEKQCLKLGGTPLGNCSSYDTCCVFKSTCGESTSQNCTYFESPNYPKYFPSNDTQDLDDVFWNNSDYDNEDGTEEPPPLQYDYETDNSLDDGSSTTLSSSDYVTDEIITESVGDEFSIETEALTDIPLTLDDEIMQDITEESFTEESFTENFEIIEMIEGSLLETGGFELGSRNNYDEYTLARQSNLVENFACTLKILKQSEKVQQMKIEFIDLELMGPNADGDCIDEKLMISGQKLNAQIPVICGYNSGQHVYIDVSTLSGPLQLSILSNDVYPKRYKIRVCQLETPCVNAMNCLQYYTDMQGVISSFNYDQAVRSPRSEPQYLSNLNYAICIRREAGYCSTTFANVNDENIEYPFDIRNGNDDGDNTEEGYDVGPVNCPDDFIVINNMRICGQTFRTVTDTASSPITIIPVHTNDGSTGMGFKLFYTQNRCTN